MKLQEKGFAVSHSHERHGLQKKYPCYLDRFVTWVKRRKLSIRIERTYPLAGAAQAHTAFEQRRICGRGLLLP
jgi:NADPH:quinone reductase